MATRSELLLELNRFSDDQLAKLVTIGDSILSPLDTNLLAVDFAGMVDLVFKDNGLADLYFPQWTDRSKADFGRLLVELFAVFSDKDFTYINHFSNEGFGAKAELYRSLFHKALNQGFNPPGNKSASGNVEVVFSPGAAEFVPRGAISIGYSLIPTQSYINDEFTIPASGIDTPVTVVFRHGSLRQEQGFFDGYSIRLDNANTVYKSMRLTIDGDAWTEVDSFIDATGASKVYMVVYDEEGKPEIIFGRGGKGAIPGVDVIWEAEFITGGGYIGDIEENTTDTILKSTSFRNLLSYTQFDMVGGAVQLKLEDLRQVIIGRERNQNRIVTPEDVYPFIRELEFVKKSFAEAFQHYLYVYILPKSGGDLTQSQKTAALLKLLGDTVDDQKLLMGYRATIASPIYVAVKLRLDVYLSNDTPRSGAQTVVSQTIEEYLNPQLGGDFGKGVNRSQLSSLLLGRLRGATNVVFTILHRSAIVAPAADLVFSNQEVVNYAASTIEINLIGGK